MDSNSDTYWFYIIEAEVIEKLLFLFSQIFHFQNNNDVGSGFRPNIPNFRSFDWPNTDPRLAYLEKMTFPSVESVLKSLFKNGCCYKKKGEKSLSYARSIVIISIQ